MLLGDRFVIYRKNITDGDGMAIYVDPMFDTSWADKTKWPFDEACHMMADSEGELHAMARRLGLKREWHQASPPHSVSHYDLTVGKRRRAVYLGAIEVDRGFRPQQRRLL